MNSQTIKPVIIGAGPAGLACSYTLAQNGRFSLIIEKDENVGGLCQTIDFDGYLFDIGGHRFLSKSELINKMWHELLGDNLIRVKRLSRIYYKEKFFNYPLTFYDTFRKLGVIESSRCVSSYLSARMKKPRNDKTFDGWIINRFGKRLFEIFFNTYTSKVWGVDCKDISADWAAQRIEGLSLKVVIKKIILGTNIKEPKTLSENFHYPRKGPGEFYDIMKKRSYLDGAQFLLKKKVIKINHKRRVIRSIEIRDSHGLAREEIPVNYIFSSIPLPLLIKSLNPQPPKSILLTAEKLGFRSFIAVNVIINKEHLFPDQWIYIHSPDLRLGRIQNYKNWSPSMTLDPKKTSLGLEYFCSEGDSLWNMNDIDLIDFAVGELEKTGIVSRKYFIDGFVVRRTNVYPIYSIDYKNHLSEIRDYLSHFSNFQTIGRGGLFRYGNSDHAMLTGIFAAENLLKKSSYDIWSIGKDQEYLERSAVDA